MLPVTVLTALSAVLVSRSSALHLHHTRGTLTAQYATEVDGNYLLSNNLWGKYSGSGSQSTTESGTTNDGGTLAWS